MIANQNDIFSPREYITLELREREKQRKCSSPDLVLACVWPYVSPAECGKRTCSCTEGRRSSPRSSRACTWCAPLGKSSACSRGRSRGRSTVGQKHLEFQVAGLRQREGQRGQRTDGTERAPCPVRYEVVSVQSAPLCAVVKVGTATHTRLRQCINTLKFARFAEFCSWALGDKENITDNRFQRLFLNCTVIWPRGFYVVG